MEPETKISANELVSYAAALNGHPCFREIVRRLKEAAIREWAGTTPADAEGRDFAYNDLRAVGRLEGYVQQLTDNRAIDARKAERAAAKKGA